MIISLVACNPAYFDDKCNGILDEHRCTRNTDCCFFKLKHRDLKYEYCISRSLTMHHVRDFYNTYNDFQFTTFDGSDLFIRDLYTCCTSPVGDKLNPVGPDTTDKLQKVKECITNSTSKLTPFTTMELRMKCMIAKMQKRGESIELSDFKCLSSVLSIAATAALFILF